MATRFLQENDLVLGVQLYSDVLAELRADFGAVQPLTVEKLRLFITDPKKRAIAYLTPNLQGTLQGILLAENTQLPLASGWWQITSTWTRKSLTTAQRLTGFRDLVKKVAIDFPNITIWGKVKVGGKLDNHMLPKPFTRIVVESTIEYFPDTDPDPDVSNYHEIITPRFVTYSALAPIVAANI